MGEEIEIIEIPTKWEIEYRHTAGKFASKFFHGLKEKKIYGVKCPKCGRVLIPPRAFCERCFVPLEEWVEVSDTGTVVAYTITYRHFVGHPKPPFCLAFIKLDGADTCLMHLIGPPGWEALADPEKAKEVVKVGMRVKAVWAEERKGTIMDIKYFEPVK